MRHVRALRTLLAGAAMLAALAAPVLADGKGRHDDDRDDADRAYQGAKSGVLMPLSALKKIVLAAYPGQIVETEFEDDDGVAYYEFYVLRADGRVLEIEIDARSGRFIDVDEDD